MADTIYGFDREGVRRIGETVQAVLGELPATGQRKRRLPPIPPGIITGIANVAIAKNTGAENNVSVTDGPQGSEADTGRDITAWNLIHDIPIDATLIIAKNGRGYYIIAAECP